MGQILVVEDNELSAKHLELVLKKSGHEVVIARDVVECKQSIQKGSFDLILMDVTLPDGDGLDLSEWILSDATASNCPIIIISAHESENYRQRAVDMGCIDYFIKPVVFKDLISRIDSIKSAS